MPDVTVTCGCTRKMTLDAIRGRGAFRCGCGSRIKIDQPEYRADTCVAPVGTQRCGQAIQPDNPIPICRDHGREWRHSLGLIAPDEVDAYIANRMVADLGGTPDTREDVAWLATRASGHAAAVRKRLADEGPVRTKADVVYYVQFSDRVKIGTTGNLARRLLDIPHDRLLAVEPGNVVTERARHGQFAALWVTGEWFRYEEPLATHIATVRRSLRWV